MNEDKLDIADLRNKILKGLDLTMERLIRQKQKEDGEFAFSENGQIVIVKANDLPRSN